MESITIIEIMPDYAAKELENERDAWKREAESWRLISEGWKQEATFHVKKTQRLINGIQEELKRNAHLADGDDCTLIGFKMLLEKEDR